MMGQDGPLVLLVDDEEAIVSMVAVLASDQGYRVLTAAGGEQALGLARREWPQLVITDMKMPGLSGEQLIAALRAEAANDGRVMPKVVLMTAYSWSGQALHADAIVRKPFELEQMEELMQRLLDGVVPE